MPRWQVVALMVNGIVGAGIYGLPSKVHALTGVFGLAAILVCAVVVLGFTLCFAEVSSRFAITGGPYLYARRAFPAVIGFQMGWLTWVTRVTALATISSVMTSYLAFFWSPAGAGWGRAAVTSATLVTLSIVNLVGVRPAAGTSSGFAIAKVVPLLAFVAIGLGFLEPGHFANAKPPGTGSFTQAVLLMIFAFGGFEAVVITAGEMEQPQRDLPFALLATLAFVTVLYLAIQVVCIGTLPGLAGSERPLSDATARFLGTQAATAIAIGALISSLGTLSGSLLVAPRVMFAMTEQGQLPGFFGRIHPRFRTPHVAIVLTCVSGIALALSGTFTYLASLSVVARLIAYLTTAGALLVLRRREGPAPRAVPAGGAIAVAAITVSVWLIARSGLRELRDIGVAVLAGLVLYGLSSRSRSAS